MGITAAMVSDLVDTFYGHVRDDDMLGPVFARAATGSHTWRR